MNQQKRTEIMAEVATKIEAGKKVRPTLLEAADKYNESFHTLNSLWYRVSKKAEAQSKNLTTTTTYTRPDHLQVGETAEVVDAVLEQNNGKIITITKIGKIFIEGLDQRGAPLAAYKVKKATITPPVVEKQPEAPAEPVKTEPVEATPAQKGFLQEYPTNDELVWEKKLVYDVQTANHFYKVQVNKKQIEILDGEEGKVIISRDRLDDVCLILKNLPQILSGE